MGNSPAYCAKLPKKFKCGLPISQNMQSYAKYIDIFYTQIKENLANTFKAAFVYYVTKGLKMCHKYGIWVILKQKGKMKVKKRLSNMNPFKHK